jgi:hypothetical protein
MNFNLNLFKKALLHEGYITDEKDSSNHYFLLWACYVKERDEYLAIEHDLANKSVVISLYNYKHGDIRLQDVSHADDFDFYPYVDLEFYPELEKQLLLAKLKV